MTTKGYDFLVISTRGLAILFRYICIIGFTYFLSKDDFANYNLLLSYSSLLLFFIGLDYYNLLHRSYYESYKVFLEKRNNYLNTVPISIIIILIINFFFLDQILVGSNLYVLSALFGLIVISELILLEFYRFEILKRNLLLANFFLFVRYLWMLIYLLIVFFLKQKGLNLLIYTWVITNTLVSFIITVFVYKNHIKTIKFNTKFFRSILFDIKGVLYILVSSILFRAIFFADKWTMEYASFNKETIALYSLVFLISTPVNIIYDVLITSYYYGDLLEHVNKNKTAFINRFRSLFQRTFFMASLVILTGLLLILINFNINIFSYSFSTDIVGLAIISQSFYILGLPVHYKLYCYKKDKFLLFGNLSGIFSFMMILLFLIYFNLWTMHMMFIALSLAFLAIFCIKFILIIHIEKSKKLYF